MLNKLYVEQMQVISSGFKRFHRKDSYKVHILYNLLNSINRRRKRQKEAWDRYQNLSEEEKEKCQNHCECNKNFSDKSKNKLSIWEIII